MKPQTEFFLVRFLLMLIFSVLTLLDTSRVQAAGKPRGALFVGVDISGSFLKGPHFSDSLLFLANYLYLHLNGIDDFEIPKEVFVGSIGGAKKDDPKTMFPREVFENKSVDEILAKLKEIFPASKENPFTDFNAFMEQVKEVSNTHNLAMKPITILMLTDGIPDLGGKDKHEKFRAINLSPLEFLSRNVTVRLLYTNADSAKSWNTKVKRTRVKIWTQDDLVMKTWRDEKIFIPNKPIAEQDKLFNWIKKNVDFQTRSRRVD